MNQQQEIKKLGHGGVKSLIKKALELGIKVTFLSYGYSLIKLQFKDTIVFIKKGEVPVAGMMSNMTKNKHLTKVVLGEIGIKTPKGIVATSLNEALLLIKKNKLSFPLVIKPIDGSLARGVSWDIRSKDEIKKAVTNLAKKKSFQKSKKFLVEESFAGDEFRVLVFNKKVISCVKKIPATVIGDGNSTIKKLVATFNKKRLRGFEIKVDTVVKNTLKKNKLTLDSIIPKDFHLKLRHNLNMSDGGRCVEHTTEIHNHFKEICEEATATLGLTYGGLDFMTKDITSAKSPYVILEVNPNPFYNMHEKPLVEGQGIDVSSKILTTLFPELK